MLDVFGLADDPKARVVTYVSTQHRRSGPRLRATDHSALVAELQKLVRDQGRGWALEVVELGDGVNGAPRVDLDANDILEADKGRVTLWPDHVRATLKSSVMLGGSSLAAPTVTHIARALTSSTSVNRPKTVPCETQVLAALLVPFLGPHGNAQVAVEQQTAVETFEYAIRTWKAASHEVCRNTKPSLRSY